MELSISKCRHCYLKDGKLLYSVYVAMCTVYRIVVNMTQQCGHL